MCGIAGYWARAGSTDRWSGDLRAATDAIAHRGPDDHGWLFSQAHEELGFGHRRLSIVDLSEHGHQPMASRCGQWVMVFNGEVYNFAEIKRELESLGHRFSGTGDSEVLLAAFVQFGRDAVQRFIEMFAIALWSAARRRLYLLRDRVGVMPLYYRWAGDTTLFGSELKAVRAFTAWGPEIDREGLTDFFRFGYSPIRGRSVRPAKCSLVIALGLGMSARRARCSMGTYSTLPVSVVIGRKTRCPTRLSHTLFARPATA